MTRPACAAVHMAALAPLVKLGLVARADALCAVGAWDAEGWADGVVTVRNGQAVYRTEAVQKPEPRGPKAEPVKKVKAEKPIIDHSAPLFEVKREKKARWIPEEGEIV